MFVFLYLTMNIKQIPEDFYVEEDFRPSLSSGDYAYFTLKKRGWSTINAIEEIAQRLNAGFDRFGYCGNKDKNGITIQHVSAFKINKEQLEGLKINDIEIKFLGYGNERFNLGRHNGNFFKIVVRDLDKMKEIKTKRIKNLFDEQRFGKDGINWKVGKVLVKGEFKEACRLLGLEIDGNDSVGALRTLGNKRLRFFVNAYQSYLWNKVVDRMEPNYAQVELMGYLTEIKEGDIEVVYHDILRNEWVFKENFMIKAIPDISSEGSLREMCVEPRDLKVEWGEDELNKSKKKAVFTFWLPKGAYGSMVVKELFR